MAPLFGIRPVPKLDLLCLAEPPDDDGAVGGDDADAAPPQVKVALYVPVDSAS